MGGGELTRPVAPQQASRASSMTTLTSLLLSSSRRCNAADAPEMPLPMITMSALRGRDGVVRWPRRTFEGSLCQKDLVELGVGRLARSGKYSSPVMLMLWRLLN